MRSIRTTAIAVLAGLATAVLTAAPAAAVRNDGPDLEPTAITFDQAEATVGHRIHFDSGIQNLGDAPTGVFNIKWLVDLRDVGAYGSHAGLPRHAVTMDGNSAFDWTFDTPGLHYVTFNVDVDGHVNERNEGNNSRNAVVDVRAADGGPGDRPPAGAGAPVQLGGLDLAAYCRSRGYAGTELQGRTAYDWRCVGGEGDGDPFSVLDACRWQYHTADAIDRIADYNDPFTWQCWNAPQLLGGVGLREYCQAHEYADVRLLGRTAYDWRCVRGSGGEDHISILDVCRWQYATNDVIDRMADYNDATSWQCWAAGARRIPGT